MSISAYLDSLANKHDELEQELHDAYLHHCEERVQEIKREKLLVKDKISVALCKMKREEAA
ncbi:MAG: YdcH family protein [Rickettsiales bacterium]